MNEWEAQRDLEERERFWEEVLLDWETLHGHESVLWYLKLEQDIKDGLINVEGM